MGTDTRSRRFPLVTEQTAVELEEYFQAAYDELEHYAMGLSANTKDPTDREQTTIELADIGALAVVVDRVEVQLTQSGRMLESLKRSMVQLIVMRAEQQPRLRPDDDV